MNMIKRIPAPARLLASMLALAFAIVPVTAALAQGNYTRLVIAFPPGGPSDLLARTLSEQLGKELGGTVIVENRPGGNGAIAAQYVSNAPADGKALWLTTAGAVTINPVLYPKLAYDMNDFTPVSLVVNNEEVLVVNAKNPARDAKEFVQNAIASKGASIASSGIGSMPHMAMALLTESTRGPFLHVPTKGAAPAITNLMGGHVDGFFGDIPGVLPFIQSGALRPIGITASKRHAMFPDVKTFDEMGMKGINLNNWSAIYVSKKVPPATVDALNKAIRRALENPAVHKTLSATGTDPQASTPAELAALVKSDLAKWQALIKANDIKPE